MVVQVRLLMLPSIALPALVATHSRKKNYEYNTAINMLKLVLHVNIKMSESTAQTCTVRWAALTFAWYANARSSGDALSIALSSLALFSVRCSVPQVTRCLEVAVPAPTPAT